MKSLGRLLFKYLKVGYDSGEGGIKTGTYAPGSRERRLVWAVMNGQTRVWWGIRWVRTEPLPKERVLLQCAGKMKTEGRGLHGFTGGWRFLGGWSWAYRWPLPLRWERADSLVSGWWELCAVSGGGNGLVALGRRNIFCNCRMCGWSMQIAYL